MWLLLICAAQFSFSMEIITDGRYKFYSIYMK